MKQSGTVMDPETGATYGGSFETTEKETHEGLEATKTGAKWIIIIILIIITVGGILLVWFLYMMFTTAKDIVEDFPKPGDLAREAAEAAGEWVEAAEEWVEERAEDVEEFFEEVGEVVEEVIEWVWTPVSTWITTISDEQKEQLRNTAILTFLPDNLQHPIWSDDPKEKLEQLFAHIVKLYDWAIPTWRESEAQFTRAKTVAINHWTACSRRNFYQKDYMQWTEEDFNTYKEWWVKAIVLLMGAAIILQAAYARYED